MEIKIQFKNSNDQVSLEIENNLTSTFQGNIVVNEGIVVDDTTINDNSISTTSNNFNFDINGNIVFNSNSGNFTFSENSSSRGKINFQFPPNTNQKS